ncbi:MAG TPA: GNAT family N-acetyltransferase, partial [Stellaceae bacterium]|nr:GNAT family N-acetyltransferase [Stellaceae bacterium]
MTTRHDQTIIRRLATLAAPDIAELAAILVDCVQGGASVGFMQPITAARAADFWRSLAGEVAEGARVLLVADGSSGIVGTVQVIFAKSENQPHRADIAKMLVHRRARGRGIGAALMRAAEEG